MLTDLFLSNKVTYEDVILAGLEALARKNTNTELTTTSRSSTQAHTFTMPSAYMPPLSRTNMSFPQITIMSAAMANAAHIGLDIAAQLSIGPHSGFASSPFFSASLKGTTLSDDTIASSYSALKPDLRPCALQITHEHPLYIDVFPMPSFRKRIIALRAANAEVGEDGEKVFDEEAFMHDLDGGGVHCWGHTPWDRRSWEAASWFLRKWAMLTGGVDGEMGRQSRWWAESRGEVFEEL